MAMSSKRLLSSKLLDGGAGEDDPMGSMGNLMDVMLVFACGLMIALVARYNVDLTSSSVDVSGNVQQIDAELEQMSEGIAASESQYAEVGTLYRDMGSGELYVIVPEGANDGGNSGTSAGEGSGESGGA